MRRPVHQRGLGEILLLTWVLFSGNTTRAQETRTAAPQYRFGSDSIPAASAGESKAAHFSSESAKAYLEMGADLWAKQKKCVSCHTHGIFMATRPAMTPFWGKPSDETRQFFTDQAKEAREGDEYGGSAPVRMAYMARGLAAWDAQFNETTSPETDLALRHVFAMQAEDGSIRAKDRWPPLNSTTWHGSVMTAIAIGEAPGWLPAQQSDEDLIGKIEKLKSFLRETPPKNDHERLLLLWASTRLPGILTDGRRKGFVTMIRNQQREDGGWSTRTFATLETWGGGRRAEQLVAEPDYEDPPSDGYQTGLAVLVLRDAGVLANDPALQQAVEWLRSNQRESGRWWTKSLNTESRFHYITYSGSAYAALALAKCNALE